jgi:imidazolonepropionase-like amidohydrolase
MFLLPLLMMATSQPRAQADLVLRHVNVIDVSRGRVLPDQRIVICGNRIESVDVDSNDPISKDAVNLTGKFVIPGLWDMHTHVTFYPGKFGPDALAATLPLYVANGVLGVRDMGSIDLAGLVRTREEIETGRRVGPRLVVTGRPLDGPIPTDAAKQRIESAEEGREAVRDLKKAGADFVKVYDRLPKDIYLAIADECKKTGMPFTGHIPQGLTAEGASRAGQKSLEHMGLGKLRNACYAYIKASEKSPPDTHPEETKHIRELISSALNAEVSDEWAQSTIDFLKSTPGSGAVASMAKELGKIKSLTLLRRTDTAEGIVVCLMAEHERASRTYKMLTMPNGKVDWLPDEPDVLDSERLQQVAAILRENNTWITPTLTPLWGIAARDELMQQQDVRLELLSDVIRRLLDPKHDPRYNTWTQTEWSWMRRSYKRDAEMVPVLAKAGVKLLAGTDAVTDYCIPGFALHDELELLVKAGLTTAQALRTATVNPAEYLGKQMDFGEVKAGKMADLVILVGNPLEDIRKTTTTFAVIQNGGYLDSDSLNGMLYDARR